MRTTVSSRDSLFLMLSFLLLPLLLNPPYDFLLSALLSTYSTSNFKGLRTQICSLLLPFILIVCLPLFCCDILLLPPRSVPPPVMFPSTITWD